MSELNDARVRAEGADSIAVGGNVTDSVVITGGVQIFVGRYERLSEAYLDPAALYRELHADAFTGRAWLASAIDDFIASNDRGWVLIEAEAGMGKTALMAWLIRERGYAHHFVRLMPDIDDVGVALRNLAAQLIQRWDLDEAAVGGVLPQNSSRPDFFANLLFDAATRRDSVRPGEPIVIAVDGLNETTPPAGLNPLGLPADLPPGVFIIGTQRTNYLRLTIATARRVLRIRPDSPENQADLRSYLTDVSRDATLAAQLEATGFTGENFVDTLVDWSRGLWLIIRYAIAELRTGKRTLGDLNGLPSGLWQYYANYWSDWRDKQPETWAGTDLPILATLTAIQEPVSFGQLCRFAGIHDDNRVRQLLDDTWRPFLEVADASDGEPLYAAFHATLVEFVAAQVDLDDLTSAEQSFVRLMGRAHREAHTRIADHYLSSWGGIDTGLPALESETHLVSDGYGLKHVIAHLVLASMDEVLHAVMAMEWARVELPHTAAAANTWYEVHRRQRAFTDYALDIERAWGRTEEPAQAGRLDRHASGLRAVSLQLRYALMAASLNSLANNISADLLDMLTAAGQLTPAQAYDLASQATDPRHRAEALAKLLPRLSGADGDAATREALAAAATIPDGYWRAGEVVRLIGVLQSRFHSDVESIIERFREPYFRQIARRALEAHGGPPAPPPDAAAVTPFLTEDPVVFAEQYVNRADSALKVLATVEPSEIREPYWRGAVLAYRARGSAPAVRADELAAALSWSLTIGDNAVVTTSEPRPVVPEHWAPSESLEPPPTWHVSVLAASGQLERAFQIVDRESDPRVGVTLLLRIAEEGRVGQRDPIAEAMQKLLEVHDPEARRRLVPVLAPALAGAGRVSAAMDLVGQLPEEKDRAASLVSLAPLLGASDVEQALAMASDIRIPVERGRIIAALLPVMAAHDAEPGAIEERLRECLHLLASGTRGEFVSAVPGVTAGLMRVGGESAVAELAAAFALVERWWP